MSTPHAYLLLGHIHRQAGRQPRQAEAAPTGRDRSGRPVVRTCETDPELGAPWTRHARIFPEPQQLLEL